MNLGAFGESYAAGFLSRQGYHILERNVRYRFGEIDLVAQEGADLVFVEVKTRRTGRFGRPEESITASRFEHLQRAIDMYLSSRKVAPKSYRVDVVAIEIDPKGGVTRCEVLKGVEAPR